MKNNEVKVKLPGAGLETTEFILKDPQLLNMASQGKIPNPLLGQVTQLFFGENPIDTKKEDALKNMNDLTTFFCKACMVKPTYEEIQNQGGLTDFQKITIYNYALKGVKAIEPFFQE